jgi:hypothetical protein
MPTRCRAASDAGASGARGRDRARRPAARRAVAGLDAATRADLLHDAAAALRAGVAATIVVVHDRAEAGAADRLVVLLDNAIARRGPQGSRGRPPSGLRGFLEFDGALSDGDGVLLNRPVNVTIDQAGDVLATVGRLIPLEDGVRVQLETERGTVFALADVPGPAVGDRVALRVTGGVRYPRESI